jgi:hypothetical protein
LEAARTTRAHEKLRTADVSLVADRARMLWGQARRNATRRDCAPTVLPCGQSAGASSCSPSCASSNARLKGYATPYRGGWQSMKRARAQGYGGRGGKGGKGAIARGAEAWFECKLGRVPLQEARNGTVGGEKGTEERTDKSLRSACRGAGWWLYNFRF